MKWDPSDYLRFSDERGRPFTDLMARVAADDPAYVVDLGCGPGNLTALLSRRWPQADVHGVDSSPEMIERAQDERAAGVRFSLADLRTWAPERPVDVLTCNATLQWVPGHFDLLDRLVAMLAPSGWFAFQVPGNFAEPAHVELRALIDSPRWTSVLAGRDIPTPGVAEPADYLARMVGLGCRADVWETTYLQVLPGEDAVLRWMTGTGLRPVLSVLSDRDRGKFTADYRERLRVAYPQHDYGTVLPYRRIFAVSQLGASR
jgi:trans-aconitate 2-methyltransferase